MRKLTEITIKSFKIPENIGRHSDGAGLFFELLSSGRKRWIYRYRVKIDGKWSERTLVLGTYPQMTLAKARQELAIQKSILDAGEDPSTKRKEDKRLKEKARDKAEREKLDSFENIALEFWEQNKENWSKNHFSHIKRSLGKDVFPVIGNIPIAKVTPQDILGIIRTIENRGSYEIAAKVLQRTRAVFAYAVRIGKAKSNPANDMQGVLKKRPVIHRKALPKIDLPDFFTRLSASTDHSITKAALKFIVLTTVRQGEARHALWPEIDFTTRMWSIPAERMKMKKPHIIYLSDQALKILEEMKKHAISEEGLIFPGIKNPYKPLSDGTILKSLNSMGYAGKATVHGFRALFSSIANEISCFDKDAIERQLAHREKNHVRAAYHRSEYLEERKKIMIWWGAWLEAIEQRGALVPEEDYIP